MTWIENGHLVLNGTGVVKRLIYAEGLTCGKTFKERFERDRESFMLTKDFNSIDVAGLISKYEKREATRDVKPCAELFERIKACIDSKRGSDYAVTYICDEPECRGISPVYLRYIYEYLKEIDPGHIVYTSSRAGRRYVDCADLLETHPYLSCYKDENGNHCYGTHPNKVGDFIDAFECSERPDKCVGFLPTCFAYRWDTSRNDYPTYDDYIAHCWAAFAHGAKSLWPYAGHDLGDRPALYHGVRQMFRTAAALEPFILYGKRETKERSADVEHTVWKLKGEILEVKIDFKTMKTKLKMPAAYQRKIGPTHEETAKVVEREEQARLGRDNQLRGRYDDIVFTSNMKANHGGGYYKLIDGTLDMISRYSGYITNAYIEASFVKMTPVFDRVRVYGLLGNTIGDPVVSIRRRGEWVALTPQTVRHEGTLHELVFPEAYSTVRMKIVFPGTRSRSNDIEIYELELPRTAKKPAGAAKKKSSAAAIDEGVVWKLDGGTLKVDSKPRHGVWTGKEADIRRNERGGFTVSGHLSRYLDLSPEANWIVLDLHDFRNQKNFGYRRWDASLHNLGMLASTVTYPHAGLYTIELEKRDKPVTTSLSLMVWGLELDFDYIAQMKAPANRVICRAAKGVEKIAPGETISIGVTLAEPCEELSAEFLVRRSTGRLSPFPINGTSELKLRSLDDEGRRWGARVNIEKCGEAGAREVYVEVHPLGGAFNRAILGNFARPFVTDNQLK